MQFLAWHAVTSSLWLVTLRTLAGLWYSSRPSPLSTAFQPHQYPHRVVCDKLPLVCSSVPRPYVFQVSCVLMIFSCLPSANLQVALDAVARRGRQWRFSFGIGPTKSAVMVFGPRRSIPPCSVHLGGDPLPIVMEYPFLEVTVTPTLSWAAHARDLVTRENRLFTQCVAWRKTEGLSLRFASTLFTSYVLPSISWESEFFISSPPALRMIDSVLRR